MRIAVTTDFSRRSREAFGLAGLLAKKFSAELYVFHQAQPSILSASQDTERFYASLDEKLKELVASETAFEGLDARPALVRGGNIIGFAQTLQKRGIDLLVVATHGRTGVKRFLLGSFVERTIRFAQCPVLVCHADQPDDDRAADRLELRRLLVAVDFSLQSQQALDTARRWAVEFGARIRLLHVVDSECGVTGFEIELFSDWHEYHQEKKRQAHERFEKLISETKDVEVDCEVKIGHPVLEILSESEAFNADLIVMGTHGGSPLEQYLLGSVAEKIVRKAARPVLLVRDSTTSGPS